MQQHQRSSSAVAAATAVAAQRGRVGRHLANRNDMHVSGSTTATRCCSCSEDSSVEWSAPDCNRWLQRTAELVVIDDNMIAAVLSERQADVYSQ